MTRGIVVRAGSMGAPARTAPPLAYKGNLVRTSTPDSVVGGSFGVAGTAEHNPGTGFEQRAYWHFDTLWTPAGRQQLWLPVALQNALTATLTLMTVDWDPATLTFNNQPAATGSTRTLTLASGSADALPGIGRDRHETPGGDGATYLRLAPASGSYYGLRIAVSADEADVVTAEMMPPSLYLAPFIVS